ALVGVAMEELDLGPAGAAPVRRLEGERAAGIAEHDAVVVEGTVFADEPPPHIGEHALRVAVIGMCPTSATAGPRAHRGAALDDVAVAEGLEGALVRAPGVDAAAAAARRPSAGHSPGWVGDAVDAHGQHGLRSEHLDFANDPAAPAPAARSAAISVDRIA